MTDILIVIPGHPVGKGRARSARMPNGRTIHYTPQKTRTWEGIAKSLAMDAMDGRDPLACPLRVSIIITHAIPDSWPAWKREAALGGRVEPTVKPDASNIIKAAEDALNGVVWADDCQIVSMTNERLYGVVPGVRILVSARDTLPAQIKRRPA